MTGLYVMEAVATVFSDKKNKHPYPGYPKIVETMDEGLAKKRKLAELTAMRNQFLAVSKAITRTKELNAGEPT